MDPDRHDEESARIYRYNVLETYPIGQLTALLEQEKDRNTSLPHGEQLRHYFAGLSQSEVSFLAGLTRARLEAETDVLARFLEVNLDPFVKDLRDISLPFDVRYVSESEIHNMTAAGVRSNACYTAGKIYFGGEPPDLKDRFFQVASRGMLGNDLFHEVFHGFQDAGGKEVFWSLTDVLAAIAKEAEDEPKVALAEAHAWLCTLRGFKDEVLIHALKTSYRFINSSYLDAAFSAIRDLTSLGMNDMNVGRLVGNTRWDESTLSYVLLESRRDEILVERNKSRERLAAKVEKHKLIERILAVRAVGIAREVCLEGIYQNTKSLSMPV